MMAKHTKTYQNDIKTLWDGTESFQSGRKTLVHRYYSIRKLHKHFEMTRTFKCLTKSLQNDPLEVSGRLLELPWASDLSQDLIFNDFGPFLVKKTTKMF